MPGVEVVVAERLDVGQVGLRQVRGPAEQLRHGRRQRLVLGQARLQHDRDVGLQFPHAARELDEEALQEEPLAPHAVRSRPVGRKVAPQQQCCRAMRRHERHQLLETNAAQIRKAGTSP